MSLLTAPFEISRSDYLSNSTLIQPISTDWPVFSPGPFLDFTKNGAAPTQRAGQPFSYCQVPLGGPNLVQFGEGCGNRRPGNAGLCNSDLQRSQSVSGRVPTWLCVTDLLACWREEASGEGEKMSSFLSLTGGRLLPPINM